MKKRKLLLQSVSLLIMVLLILFSLHYLLLPKNYDDKLDLDYPYSYCMWQEFYKIETNSLEIISLGSSHSNCAINPLILSRELSVDAFNLSTMGADIKLISYQLEEVLAHQRPEVVTVELFSLFGLTNQAGYYSIGMQGMHLSETKLNAVSELLAGKETENLLPIVKNHVNWKYIELPKDITRAIKHDTTLSYNGYLLYDTIYKNRNNNSLPFASAVRGEEEALTEEQEAYLNRILALCQSVDAQLVFVITPYFNQDGIDYTDMLKRIPAIEAYCTKNEIGLINCFEETEAIHLTMDDFLDAGHMNMTGAYKISNLLADYLKANYGNGLDGRVWEQKEQDMVKDAEYKELFSAE